MNIAQLRQQFPFLREFTDDEVAGALIAAHGVTDRKDPRYSSLERQLLGYDRSLGEKLKDTGVGLAQGVVGIGETAGILGGAALPGVKAFDNPVVNSARSANQWLDQFKSPGLQRQETGADVAGDIAVRDAAAEGSGLPGRIWAGAKARGGAYITNPGLAVQDVAQSAPSLVVGGLAGRAVQGGLSAAGAGAQLAARGGLAAGVGASSVLQGGDVAGDTYERMREAGADYETASREASAAGVKGGVASLGLSALPGAATIERSMIRGVAGRGGVVGAVRGGAAEFASEAAEEGYGRFAGNQAVRTVDPNVDPASGVGEAAIQGGMAAGPLGAIGGARRGAAPAPAAPRTEIGEIDLTGSSQYAQYDTPTYIRQGQDPTFERSSPWTPPSQIQDQERARALANPRPPGYLQSDQDVPAYLRAEPTMADIAGEPVNPVQRGTPNMADLYAEETPNPFDTPAPQRSQAKPTVGTVLMALEKANTELGKNVIRKDGQVSNGSGTAPLRAVLEAKDPVAKLRELYQDGKNPRDELLDVWHRELTGKTIAEAKTTVNGANSAGFVSEPADQIKAQLQALRQGRINAVVLGQEDAAKTKLNGLTSTVVTDSTGASGIVVSRTPKVGNQAAKRAKEVGLKQALGEAKGVVDPTITSQPVAGAVAVQQIDTKTGKVLHEEVARPDDVGKVKKIPGTKQRVVPVEQAMQERVQGAAGEAQVQQVPAKGPTLMQRRSAARSEGIGAAMDGLGRGANPHKAGSVAHREWLEGHDEVVVQREAAQKNPIAKKLVEVVDSTKDEVEYDESLYALYKLAAKGDVTAFNYFHENGYYNERNEQGNPDKLKPAQRAEMAKLRQRWETEMAQARGKKFGAVKEVALVNPDATVGAVLDPGSIPSSGVDLARDLAKNAKDAQDRQVAQRIMPYLEGVRVVVVQNGMELPTELSAYFSRAENKAAGVTAFDKDNGDTTVYVHPVFGSREDVALHELIHAATMRAIENTDNEALRSDLEATRQVVLKALAREKVDGTIKAQPARRELAQFFSTVVSDGHELLAYAFSSPTFRKFLSNLDASGNPLPRTTAEVRRVMPNLWQRVANVMRRAIGLGPAFTPYMETVSEGGMVVTGPDTISMFERLDALLDRTLTSPTGGGGSPKASLRGDVLASFGKRFGATDPATAVRQTQEALSALRKQATDYRTMAEQALARGRVETAMRLRESATNSESQVEELRRDLSLARAAEASGSAGGDVFKANMRSVTLEPLAEGARAATATLKAQIKGEEISPTLLKMLTLRQIDEQFGSKLPALRQWVSVVMERSSTASKLAAEADRVALQWQQNVSGAEMKQLAEILLRASNAELQLDNTKATYLAELTTEERREHAELRAKLEQLSPAAQQARKEALDVLKRQWTHTHDALKKFITLTVSDPELRAARLEDLEQEFGRNHGDYFPLSRFGDRVVIARGAAKDGRDIITFHESAKGVEDEVRRLKDSGLKPEKIIVTMSTEYDPRKVPGSGFVRELHAMIDNIASGEEAQQLHQTLQQLYLKALPEMSGAKHMVRRENIEGYSQDALRVFADAVTRGSRYASHLEFGPAVHAAMEAAETQSRSSDRRTAAVVIGRKEGQQPVVKVVGTGSERLAAVEKMAEDGYAVEFFSAHPDTVAERLAAALEDASPEQLAVWVKEVRSATSRATEGVEDLRAAKTLYNFMVQAQKADIDPTPSKPIELAGQLGYAWYLGFSPAFWAMNTLQNPMVGIPHLGAKYGVAKTSKEWMRAASWFAKVRIGKRLAGSTEPFSVEWLRDQVKAGDLKGISKEELDMLQRLEDRQVLDFTQAMDLSRIGAASSSTWYKAMRLAAAGAHHTEVFNRVSFALAAYRLAMKSRSDITHDEAVRLAEKDVASAHFDYSYTNKPLWMGKSSPALRLVFMFQQYRQHMLYWWANTIKEATKGESKQVQRQARKAALLMGTAQLLFAGTLGLPFIGAVSTLATLLGGGDDGEDPFNFERWLREAAVGMTGSEKAADVMLKGIFSAMGADIYKRIGQGDLLPFLNAGSARFERNFDDKTRAYLFDMLGPLGSIALGAARATEAFSDGDYLRGLAAATPKAVADIVRSYELASEGLKDKRGQHLATAEAFDGWDAALQAAGVTPTRTTNAREARGAVLDIQNELRDQSKRLTGAFIHAWTRQDTEGMQEALADIQRYNANVAKGRTPARELLITPDRLRSAIVERQRRAMLLALTGGLADTRQQLLIATRVSGLFDLEGRDVRLDSHGLPSLPSLSGEPD